MANYKTIQFKEEDMQVIAKLAVKLQSTLLTEFSKRQAVMYAVKLMLDKSEGQ